MKLTTIILVVTSLCSRGISAANLSGFSTVCGTRGYDQGIDSVTETRDGTYTGCYNACSKQSSKCKSFAYGDGECHLYDRAAFGNFEEDSDSPYTFYDFSCRKSISTSTITMTATMTSKQVSTSTTMTTTVKASATKPITTTFNTSIKNITTTSTILVPATSSKTSTIKTTTSTRYNTTTSTVTTTTTTTKKSTTLSTSATKTSSASTVNETCSLEPAGSCTNYNFTTFTDPCNKGCGCTYQEVCGGGFTGGTVINVVVGWTYSDCIRACDVHQPACVGVEHHYFRGTCYLYSSITGVDPGSGAAYPGQEAAVRQSCKNACSTGKSCARDHDGSDGSTCF